MVKRSAPRFSIVIPCFNEERYIEPTLQSLKDQLFKGSFEIIVVDNNCTDNTVAIARKYGAKIVTENQRGVCWARQAGTEAASGEIVISTDADTLLSREWLQNIDQSFKKDKNCVAVAGPCTYIDGPWWGQKYSKLLFAFVSMAYPLFGAPFYVTATNIAFKKSAWNGYHTAMTQGGDELALLHDLKHKGKVVFDNNNPVFTSGRRLNEGLFHSLFVSLLVYYLLAYHLNRLFKRTIIGMAPAYRAPVVKRSRKVWAYSTSLLIILAAFIHLPGRDTLVKQSYESLSQVIRVAKHVL